MPDYKGERDGLRGVSGCVRSPRDLRSEEVPDTLSHRRRDGNISRRPTVKLTGAGHDNQHCAGGTRRPVELGLGRREPYLTNIAEL